MTLGHSGTNYSLAFLQQLISVSTNTTLNHLDEDYADWGKDAAKVKRRDLGNQNKGKKPKPYKNLPQCKCDPAPSLSCG